MTERIVACCGLVCTDCPAYRATQTGDRELLEQTARRWSKPGQPVRPEDVMCDGCTGTGTRVNRFCRVCRVRECARGRGLRDCGHCPEYVCPELAAFWKQLGIEAEARSELDRVAQVPGMTRSEDDD